MTKCVFMKETTLNSIIRKTIANKSIASVNTDPHNLNSRQSKLIVIFHIIALSSLCIKNVEMDYERRIKLNAFQEQSTYKNDFRRFPPGIGGTQRESGKWPKIPEEAKQLPPCEAYRYSDHESFQLYKEGVHVPFDLLWEPRPIVETNPRIVPAKHSKSEFEDTGKMEAIKTRPRLFVSPAIPLDDVEEGPLKDLIIKDMYTTNLRMAQDEVAKYTRPIKRDVFETSLDQRDPLAVCVDKYPPLPKGWRTLGAQWDKKQQRACVDPTKQFWLKRPLHEDVYAKIENFVTQEVKGQISELIDKEGLRRPHDRMKALCTAYKPRLATGVPLAKINFPVVHPGVTVLQAIAKRREDSV